MKALILTAAMASSLVALPVFTPDSAEVPSNDTRIGAIVYAIPNSQWRVWGNDNPTTAWDNDYNDAVVSISFGEHSVVIEWLGSTSAWTNHYEIGSYTVSAATPFASFAYPTTGEPFNIALRTQDGGLYANGHRNLLTEQVPEPNMALIVAVGVALIAAAKIRRDS